MLGIGLGTAASSLQATTSTLFKTFSYTGTGASNSITATGFQPDLVTAFRKDGTTPSWPTFDSARGTGTYYHAYMDGISPANYNMILNNGPLSRGTSSTMYNNTAPTSSVFSLGTSRTSNSATGGATNFVAYLFGSVSGKSAFGTYTGNGSISGPSVSLGFQPSLVMIVKQVASSNNIFWVYNNSKNGEINLDTTTEDTTNYVNLTGTGFTIVTTNGDFNTGATTYLYSAWA